MCCFEQRDGRIYIILLNHTVCITYKQYQTIQNCSKVGSKLMVVLLKSDTNKDFNKTTIEPISHLFSENQHFFLAVLASDTFSDFFGLNKGSYGPEQQTPFISPPPPNTQSTHAG